MRTPLIGPEQDFAIWAVLLGLAAFGFWSDSFRWSRWFTGLGLMMIAAIVLSNTGVIPMSAPAYGVVSSYLIPIAIALLLLKADLRAVVREGGPTLAIFCAGAAGALIGALAGMALLDLGDNEAELTGVFSASYIGGSMNFAAVAEALAFADPTELAAALAADNVASTLYLLLLVLLPASAPIRRLVPLGVAHADAPGGARTPPDGPDSRPDSHTGNARNAASAGLGSDTVRESPDDDEPGEDARDAHERPPRLNLIHIALALAIALALCAAGHALAGLLGVPNYWILFVTALAVAAANLFPAKLGRLEGDFETGMLFMFIFFVTIGAGADIGALIRLGPLLFAFAGIILFVHLAAVLLAARLLRLDLAEAVVASTACALGPASAAAVAASKGWRALITPGIMCGVLGYAIANFIGVGLATLLD